MNHQSWLCLGTVAIAATILTGCGGEGDKKPAASPSPSPATSAPPPTAAAPTTPATAAPTAAVPAGFPQPVVPDKDKDKMAARAIETAAGLIPPTDGDNWAKTVSKGRQDPFAVLAFQPVENIKPEDIAADKLDRLKKNIAAKPSNAATSTSTAKAAPTNSDLDTPAPKTAATTTKKVRIAAKPSEIEPVKPIALNPPKATKIAKNNSVKVDTANGKITVSKTPLADKPGSKTTVAKSSSTKKIAVKPATTPAKSAPAKSAPVTSVALKPVATPLSGNNNPGAIKPAAVVAPEPTLARGVEVSGVIQAGGNTQVVIKLPTESFSRYVEVGDRIINGKVLVKRVEDSNTMVPTVILEEVGVEVSRKVGENSNPAAAAVKEVK